MLKGWSFCIVTAPGNEDVLNKCLGKIYSEFHGVDNYEIIVVGNPSLEKLTLKNKVRIINFPEKVFEINFSMGSFKKALRKMSLVPMFYRTGDICRKKNLAANIAKYDSMCVMHDYVGLEPGWRKGYDNFSSSWSVCMNIVLNKDGERHRDWMAWDHPALTKGECKICPCLIPYDKYTKYMYISGAYFCVKTSFFADNLLDESLFWGEGEDVEWSLRVREKTKFKMNCGSSVKYLKLKSKTDAPNCPSWIENRKKMELVLNTDRSRNKIEQ
ncbi:hypothetical protein ACWX0P_10320 [Vibrio mediterranei]